MSVTAEDIRAAAPEIAGEVVRTPLVPAARLGQSLGCELFLKLENLQYTGSFKDRGALVKLKSLTPEQAVRGATQNAARALGLDDRGTIEPGKKADLALWDISGPGELAYPLGANPCLAAYKNGKRIDGVGRGLGETA